MFFIDYQQTEVLKEDIFGEQAVGTDDQINLAGG